jgi:hypothetical protein
MIEKIWICRSVSALLAWAVLACLDLLISHRVTSTLGEFIIMTFVAAGTIVTTQTISQWLWLRSVRRFDRQPNFRIAKP